MNYLYYSFLFKIFQLVKSDELIVGEKYYIKRKGTFKNSIGIFWKYGDYDWYDEYDEYGLAIFNILDDSNDHILDVGYDIESKLNEFYKKFSYILKQDEEENIMMGKLLG